MHTHAQCTCIDRYIRRIISVALVDTICSPRRLNIGKLIAIALHIGKLKLSTYEWNIRNVKRISYSLLRFEQKACASSHLYLSENRVFLLCS